MNLEPPTLSGCLRQGDPHREVFSPRAVEVLPDIKTQWVFSCQDGGSRGGYRLPMPHRTRSSSSLFWQVDRCWVSQHDRCRSTRGRAIPYHRTSSAVYWDLSSVRRPRPHGGWVQVIPAGGRRVFFQDHFDGSFLRPLFLGLE